MHRYRPESLLTGIFLGVALAAAPAIAQTNAPAHHHHETAPAPQTKIGAPYVDPEHTADGEPVHKKAGVDFNAAPDAAALYRAAWTGDLAGVKAALEKNPALVHGDDDWVMQLAAEGDSFAVLKYLHEHGGNLAAKDNAPLMRAVGNGNVKMFDYIVANLPPIPLEMKNTLMVVACYGENTDMARRVWALGDVDLSAHAGHDDTPVSAAAKHGSLGMLKYVVEELHADIHMGNEDALRQAASHNRDDSVTYLLVRDANVHANNDEALRSAVDGGFFDEHQGTIGYGGVVKALLDHGANPFVISEQKLAETEVKYPEIAEMLRAKIAELGGRPAATFRPLTKPHPEYRIGF